MGQSDVSDVSFEALTEKTVGTINIGQASLGKSYTFKQELLLYLPSRRYINQCFKTDVSLLAPLYNNVQMLHCFKKLTFLLFFLPPTMSYDMFFLCSI